MKKLIRMQPNTIKKNFCAIALVFSLFLMVGMTPINAEGQGLSNKGPCSWIGTWHGEVEEAEGVHPLTFMAVYTPGLNNISGQVTVQWVEIDPTLGFFPAAVRVTNSYGVWKRVNHCMYQFSWIGRGLDMDGEVVYTVRSSGRGEMLDCNNVDITYTLELWIGNVDIYAENPPEGTYFCIPGGTAFETRMPLVQKN